MNLLLFCLLPIFFNMSVVISSQVNEKFSISGTVTDETTMEPLPNTNIFLSQTTIGTTSDAAGEFVIPQIQEGTYTLVVSMIGYEPYVKKIEIKKDSKILLNIYLKPKAVELNTVEIIGDKSLYEKYLKEQYEYGIIFKKYFLGQTKFSEECEITNEEKIVFKKNTRGFVEAECMEPIIIINKALGYKIECLLKYFLCNNKMESTQMLFFLKFTELSSQDEDTLDKWEENREAAYISSLRRFLKSVVNNDIQKKNYGLFLTYNNLSIQSIPRSKLLYGSEKISQIDSLSNRMELFFNGFLLVYNSITLEPSWIYLPFGKAEISNDGYALDPLTISVSGTFATHGIANLLPNNLMYEF